MNTMVIEIDGWAYEAYKAEGEWWLDPLDPDAPEVDDNNGAIMEAVGTLMEAVAEEEARRRSENDEAF